MYYGRKVNEIAPEYVKDVIKNLPSLRKKYEELDAKRREVRAHYEKLDEKSQYAEKEKLDHAEKEANDAFLDMANVVGGLMTVEDLKPVQDAYMAEYELLVKIKKLRENGRNPSWIWRMRNISISSSRRAAGSPTRRIKRSRRQRPKSPRMTRRLSS